ncbi:hypothetical protein KKD70_00735 [Patescibacteria group bacterium]|nr:hypothetical protein [Patescibacteria group bacterium]
MEIHLYDNDRASTFPLAVKSPELFKDTFSESLNVLKFCVLKYNEKLHAILFDVGKASHIEVKIGFGIQMSYEKYIEENPDYKEGFGSYKKNIYRPFRPCGKQVTDLPKAKAAGQLSATSVDLGVDGISVKKIIFDSDTFRNHGFQDQPENPEEKEKLVNKIKEEFQTVAEKVQRKISK